MVAEGRSLTTIGIGCLLLAILLMFGFVWAEAETDYMTIKPFVASLVTGPNQLKIQTIDLTRGYNITTSRWDNMTIAIFNNGAQNATGAQIYVELFNVNGTKIAVGQRALPPIKPKQAFLVSIAISWSGNATIAEYAFGKVTAT